MICVSELVSLLRELDDSGSIIQPDGTMLIRKNPPRKDGLFANSYLHEVYSGLNDDEIGELEGLIGKELPEQLRSFYKCANGLKIFAGSLSIRGLRKSYKRDVDVRLPVSLEYGNLIETPEGEERSQIRFGWYPAQDVELVVYLDKPDEVFAVPRYKNNPALFHWSSLNELLLTEYARMRRIYMKQPDRIDFLNPIPFRGQEGAIGSSLEL